MLISTTSAVIEYNKSIFSGHGIPEIVTSDNGPKFSSKQFAEFAQHYNFQHITSKITGKLRVKQTIKSRFKKAEDPSMAMLTGQHHFNAKKSPAELLIRRRLKSPVPMITSILINPKQGDFRVNEKLKAKKKRKNFTSLVL